MEVGQQLYGEPCSALHVFVYLSVHLPVYSISEQVPHG